MSASQQIRLALDNSTAAPLPVDLLFTWEGSTTSPNTLVGSVYSYAAPPESRIVGAFNNFMYRSTEITLGSTTTVTRVVLRLAKVGTPSGNLYVRIHTDSGDIPTTTVLSTSSAVDLATLTAGSGVYQDVVFTGMSAALTSGTKYHISIQIDVIDSSNYVLWGSGGSYTVPWNSAFNTFPSTGFYSGGPGVPGDGLLQFYWQAYNSTPSDTGTAITTAYLDNCVVGGSGPGNTLFPGDPLPNDTIGTLTKTLMRRAVSVVGVPYQPTGSKCFSNSQNALEYFEYPVNANDITIGGFWTVGFANADFTFYDLVVLRSSLDYSVLSQEGGAGPNCTVRVHTGAGTSSGSINVTNGQLVWYSLSFHNGGNGVLSLYDVNGGWAQIGSTITLNIPNAGACLAIRMGGSGHPSSGGPSPNGLFNTWIADWTHGYTNLLP